MFEGVFEGFRVEILIASAVLIIAFALDKILRRKKNLPPGPLGLPIVGYLPFLTKFPHLKFIELSEKYGKIFSLHLGSQLVVILNDGDDIREAFSKKELLARPPNSPFHLFGKLETPFFSPNLRMWQEQRRFVVQTMKDLGLGKSKIEGHIQDEIQHFLKLLEESKGKPMNLIKPLTPSMSNNICSLVFGERYEYDSPDRIIMDKALEVVAGSLAQTGSFIFFPWIKHFPIILKLLDLERVIEAANNIFNLIDEKIRRHKETLDPKNARDYIDNYLLEIQARKVVDPETTFSDETLKGSTLNLFGAGSETVRTSISWCMYIMAAFPDVQKRVRKEIEDVLGPSKFPQFPDQKNMPYTQAVIREVLRWKTIAPLNILRYSLDDIEVSGYKIPKGTVVIANFWSVHHDPKNWKNPEDFQPDRFLNPDGTVQKSNYFMPFSVGKRSCPGETMALMETFLYFVAILQKFQVAFPKGFKPTFEAELGVTYRVKPFEICFNSN